MAGSRATQQAVRTRQAVRRVFQVFHTHFFAGIRAHPHTDTGLPLCTTAWSAKGGARVTFA